MRRINRCLNPRLRDICKRAIQLDELNAKLLTLLPEELKTQCKVGSFNAGCLAIMVKDAVWASQLRYLLPELRDNMRKAGIYQLISIKCVVATTNFNITPQQVHHHHTLSNKARSSISDASELCTYQPLKKALMDLAGHKKDKT